jgi:hypothetical protein
LFCLKDDICEEFEPALERQCWPTGNAGGIGTLACDWIDDAGRVVPSNPVSVVQILLPHHVCCHLRAEFPGFPRIAVAWRSCRVAPSP